MSVAAGLRPRADIALMSTHFRLPTQMLEPIRVQVEQLRAMRFTM